ncbi:MAG: hypothetical protein Q7S32_00555 [bacterium]|nr:hypothetical protein [bacterium]
MASTRALEADGCAYLKVAGGMYAWVPQKKGTLYDYDAEYHPIRRHDCGNSVVEIRYPKAEPVLRAIVAAEAEPRAEAEPVPPAEAPPVFTSTPAVPVKVRQDGVVNIVGNNNEVDFRSIKVIERVHPVVVERHGMSTGTKWVIGGVAAGIVGGLVYFLVKKDKKEPAKSSSGLAPRP